MKVVAVDIGGTHARFAIADVAGGRVKSLGDPVTLRTAEHASLETAWKHFARDRGGDVPHAAAIAVATPVGGAVLKLTNNPWTIRPALIPQRLGVDRVTLINDFGAIGHAVAQFGDDQFLHLCGAAGPLPRTGVVTICGPGTGLGVAALHRTADSYHVIDSEGGHQDFAPLDPVEDAMVARLRPIHTRVSVERIVSGPGIVPIYQTLAAIEGSVVPERDDRALWALALEGGDSLASAALERFCLSLGAVAGDLALAQGARGVVIAGGLGLRLRDRLIRSGFGERFVAKGRFAGLMKGITVKLITHPQPGLFGAAAAFAQENT